MAKYTLNIKQDSDSWRADIMRKVSARESRVSQSQHGFNSEAEAQLWGEKALEQLAQKIQASNKARAEKRPKKDKHHDSQD